MTTSADLLTKSGTETVELLRRLVDHEIESDTQICMVPSENRMSTLARTPLLMDVYNRYFFNGKNEPHLWQFRGAQGLWDLENQVVDTLGDLLGADHLSVRSLSGINAMTVTMAALTTPGSRVMTVGLDQGGHPSARPIAERLGATVEHLTGASPHEIDLGLAEESLVRFQPNLVYVDQSTCLFPTDFAELAGLVRRLCPAAVLHVDVSHWLGLIIGGALPNPLCFGADSLSASTHKTFPGPHKALIATNDASLFAKIEDAESYLVSSNHFGVTLSLGLALQEWISTDYEGYALHVVDTARSFGALLADRGFRPEAAERGYTSGHQLWVDTEPAGVDAYELSGVLKDCGVLVNPWDDLPNMPAPSLRLGLHEVAYRGLAPDELAELADIFADAAAADRDVTSLRRRTAALCDRSPFPWRLADVKNLKNDYLASVLACLEDATAERDHR